MDKKLGNLLNSWSNDAFSFDEINSETICITTPFLDPIHDCVAVYLVKLADNKILLTDDGYTTDNMYLMELEERITTQGIARICQEYGLSFENNEIFVSCKLEDFPKHLFYLLSVIHQINSIISAEYYK